MDWFNTLAVAEASTQLIACCQCVHWAETIAAARPYRDLQQVINASQEAWAQATDDEILEAFQGHPQIGDLDALRNKYKDTANAEQGQVTQADESILLRLRDQNVAYREKFGFIFIVCNAESHFQPILLLAYKVVNCQSHAPSSFLNC